MKHKELLINGTFLVIFVSSVLLVILNPQKSTVRQEKVLPEAIETKQ